MPALRHRVSIFALCLAWLCANGAVWNVVQVVAWAKMFHDYSQVMPVAQALKITFDGSAPCDVCKITEGARDNERQNLPEGAALGASDKLLLAFQATTPIVLAAADPSWPGLVSEAGLIRPGSVPVPPPRA